MDHLPLSFGVATGSSMESMEKEVCPEQLGGLRHAFAGFAAARARRQDDQLQRHGLGDRKQPVVIKS